MLAVVVFASLQEMEMTAPVARPYAIGLPLVVGSILLLVRWLDTGRMRDMLSYVVLAAAIPYFHYLFTTVYLVHAAYVICCRRDEIRVGGSRIVVAAVLILLLVSPLAWNAVHDKRVSAESSFAATPSTLGLISAVMPQVTAASIFGGLLMVYHLYRSTIAKPGPVLPINSFVLLLSWLVLPIISLFLVSRFTSFKVFVPRYYLPAFAALAVLIGWAVRSLFPQQTRAWVAAFIAVTAVLSFGGFHRTISPHGEDWRGAAEAVRAAGIGDGTPVLVRVGLIETAKVRWKVDIDPDSPLLCPLSKYPMPGRIILVPSRLDQPSIEYLNDVSSKILEPASQFVLVTQPDYDRSKAWLLGRFSREAVTASDLRKTEGVSATLFRRVSQ